MSNPMAGSARTVEDNLSDEEYIVLLFGESFPGEDSLFAEESMKQEWQARGGISVYRR
jgi:hypothetical protein